MLLPIIADPAFRFPHGLTRSSTGRIYCAYSTIAPITFDNEIRLVYSDDGGDTWTNELIDTVPNVHPFDAWQKAIAIDSLDRVHAVYTIGTPANPHVHNICYRMRNATGWSARTFLTDTTWGNFSPLVAVDSIDHVHVVWSAGNALIDLPHTIYHQELTPAGWLPAEIVNQNPQWLLFGASLATDIGISLNNVLFVVFIARGFGANPAIDNEKLIFKNMGAWGAVISITDEPAGQENPFLAVDSLGNAHITWSGLGWGAFPAWESAQYVRYVWGTGLDPQEEVGAEEDDLEENRISLDSSNNIYVSYQRVTTQDSFFRVKSGGVWQTRKQVVTTFSLFASILYALWPISGGLRNNVPVEGFVTSILDGTAMVLYFYVTEHEEWPSPPPALKLGSVQTLPATNISEHNACLNGAILDDGGHWGYVRFQWGGTHEYGAETPWLGGFDKGDVFFADLTGLGEGGGYHFRAQFKNDAGIASGQDMTFATLSPLGPVTLIPEDLAYLLEAV